MLRLIPFELGKIWKKRSYVLSLCALLLVHVFLLWYTSLPDEETPPLSSYKAIKSEISDRNEEEKAGYLAGLKERMDGICFVQEILAMQGFDQEMGKTLAEQKMQEQPGVFETYYELYRSGHYLTFTDSPEQEKNLIDEMYAQQQKVAGYGEYLRSIQENKEVLGSISVFGGQEQDSYSFRNLCKSAADYADLTDEAVCFTPSMGITSAMEAVWTDLLLYLCVMLFVGSLITAEKEKKLFLITRSTKRGMLQSIGAKLAALWIHCTAAAVLFYLVSLVFFGLNTGWFDPGVRLQSVAAYTESSLSISIGGFLVLSILTKAMVLFAAAALLTVFCIRSEITVLPFLAGASIAGIGAVLYYLIPGGSEYSMLKYLNPVGLMKTENLYGGYLNYNVLGYPVSRFGISLVLIFLAAAAGIVGCVLLFCRMRSFEVRKLRLPVFVSVKPHVNILRHEGYKILVTNHAFIIFLVFAVLFIWKSFDRTYEPSVAEQYYQEIMMRLEGELTGEKESLVLAEKERYDQAFQELERLDAMVDAGELGSEAADMLKEHANMTLSFYPAFERVERQYRQIKENGSGSFVYDTGYRYLLGMSEDVFPVDFLLLTVGLILFAGGAVSMEYQTGMMSLIRTAQAGKKKVFLCKLLICTATAAVLALIPVICRAWCILSAYPMHEFGAAVQNVSCLSDFAVPMPIGLFVLVFALSQAVAAVLVSWITLALSIWRKNQVQTVFFALLFLAVPLVLQLLGFAAAKWFSLYPLYGWTGML